MLAKLGRRNQITLHKTIIREFGGVEYFDVVTRDGLIVLIPVRLQRGDALRAKLAELDVVNSDIDDAIVWARTATFPATMSK